MVRTPENVLITEGTKAANQITMILAASPRPSHRIASGIQASGGIGRMIRNTGLIAASARRLQPIHSPSGTPVATATRNPIATSIEAMQRMGDKFAAGIAAGVDLDQRKPEIGRRGKSSGGDDAAPCRQREPQHHQRRRASPIQSRSAATRSSRVSRACYESAFSFLALIALVNCTFFDFLLKFASHDGNTV